VNRLEVAVVSDALYPWHKGGKEIRYSQLLRGLPEHGMDVTVYSMKWWDDDPDVEYSDLGSLTYVAICPRISMYKEQKRSMTQALLFALCTFRLLTKKFDVIEADHMPYLQLLPLRLVAWIKRVPLVVTWHEVWGRQTWKSYIGPLGTVAATIERVSVRLPNIIVAVSEGTATKLVAIGANHDHIHVVPNSIDLDLLLASTADNSAPELLFVGRLIEHKNANLAVEATSMLVERGYDVRLGIVGVGPEGSRLKAQVSMLNLEARVTFFSTFESQNELWSLIAGSHVLLAPSVREGSGLVVAESLALGTPVVCALHPDNESSHLVGPSTGSLVEAFSAQSLADAAEHWLNDSTLRADRVAAFFDEHRELTSEAMVASYAEILLTTERRASA
jgi:glycosyltransferase involved in cell wall biosynthesis